MKRFLAIMLSVPLYLIVIVVTPILLLAGDATRAEVGPLSVPGIAVYVVYDRGFVTLAVGAYLTDG